MQKLNEDLQVNGRLIAKTAECENCILVSALCKRVDEAENETNAVKSEMTAVRGKLDEIPRFLVIVSELVDKYNNAINVINDLSERVTALESNYDPSVIK